MAQWQTCPAEARHWELFCYLEGKKTFKKCMPRSLVSDIFRLNIFLKKLLIMLEFKPYFEKIHQNKWSWSFASALQPALPVHSSKHKTLQI